MTIRKTAGALALTLVLFACTNSLNRNDNDLSQVLTHPDWGVSVRADSSFNIVATTNTLNVQQQPVQVEEVDPDKLSILEILLATEPRPLGTNYVIFTIPTRFDENLNKELIEIDPEDFEHQKSASGRTVYFDRSVLSGPGRTSQIFVDGVILAGDQWYKFETVSQPLPNEELEKFSLSPLWPIIFSLAEA